MEKNKKRILVEILKNQFENSSNFITDTYLKNEKLIEDVKSFLDDNGLFDFVKTDAKCFEINISFIQEKQYSRVILKENGIEKFVFSITKTELLQLLK